MTLTLGQLLTTRRGERRQSLRDLGRQAGIAHTTLGRWEKGTYLPRLPELEAVLTALNATASERRQALDLLDAPRGLTQVREETTRRCPDFIEAAGGLPGHGEILWALRLRAGKTLVDAARAAGVTAGTLSRWEHSEMRPETARLHALCYTLGASEEEVAALTCSEGMAALLPPIENAEQIARLGLALRLGEWQPPPALEELIYFQLEAQVWRLVPQQPNAQYVLFALTYWRMKTLFEYKRYDQLVPYVRRVLTLSETMPPCIAVPPAERDEHIIVAHEAYTRALLYQTLIAEQRAPAAGRRLARRLARQWRSAYDVYFRAWMMSEAATLLARAGENDLARDWSRQACKEADTGEEAHWTEPLFRWRTHAAILTQIGRGEEALAALESTTALNGYHPDCRAHYHLMRAEAYAALHRPAQAHENVAQARAVIESSALSYLRPSVETLERQL